MLIAEFRVKESWGALKHRLNGLSKLVQAATFSSNGQVLASATYDKTVQLWDTQTGTLQQTLKGHSEIVFAVIFSPNGRVLASLAKDTVRLWDAQTGALQQSFDCYSTPVGSIPGNAITKMVGAIAFSPNGQVFAYTPSYGGR
jgi:WD40 repeat protein